MDHKVSFHHIKQNLISNNTSNNTNSANLCSTNLANAIDVNYEFNAPNIPNCNSQNPISHFNTEDNSYTHLVSLTTYSSWNHYKCFVGNVYIPTKKHSLQI